MPMPWWEPRGNMAAPGLREVATPQFGPDLAGFADSVRPFYAGVSFQTNTLPVVTHWQAD